MHEEASKLILLLMIIVMIVICKTPFSLLLMVPHAASASSSIHRRGRCPLSAVHNWERKGLPQPHCLTASAGRLTCQLAAQQVGWLV